eukprot:m.152873 g.152873  ORF g.152873 m.152873 type:complete len:70 (+) comp17898_c0_seq2:123-332(+)
MPFATETKASTPIRGNDKSDDAKRNELPKLEKVDHTKFASEKERVAALANVEESQKRASELNFSFSFDD